MADSLAGRVELHTLWPFSQGEIEGNRISFVERAFAGKGAQVRGKEDFKEGTLVERVLVGGYPESQSRKKADRRGAWFESYITTILQRDVRDISNIENLTEVPKLLALLASRACSLVNYADIARSLTMPQSTLKRYMATPGSDIPGEDFTGMVVQSRQTPGQVSQTNPQRHRATGSSVGHGSHTSET